jgi:Cft2 family RNA processing exonuclease
MNQIASVPSYEQESQVYDNYELEFQIDFSRWANLFGREEITAFAERCVSLNYGQIYDTGHGATLTAYPSGVSIGAAVWLFQNPLTHFSCLWVQGVSHHSWRACQ